MRFWVVAALATAFAVAPTWAQRAAIPPPQPVTGDSNGNLNSDIPSAEDVLNGHIWSPADVPLTLMPFDTHWMLAAETCNSWTESSAHSPTVSVARLAVPGKASGEYQKGCGALKDKKLDEAEKHERAAVKLYPDYAAAWVVLGQILEAEDKRDDGRQACSQARSVDPDYVAPYLCLADFATTEDNWQEVSMLAGSALTLDPAGNAYSFYYAADAAFHLGNLEKAEKDAQNSITLDKWRHLAQVHLLLAQIYKAKNDFVAQAAQLREYLKIAPNAADSSQVKSVLAQLQAKITP
jgi:tetratricopeptide (TPR) repeat protein